MLESRALQQTTGEDAIIRKVAGPAPSTRFGWLTRRAVWLLFAAVVLAGCAPLPPSETFYTKPLHGQPSTRVLIDQDECNQSEYKYPACMIARGYEAQAIVVFRVGFGPAALGDTDDGSEAETRWLLVKNPRFGSVPSELEYIWVEEDKVPTTITTLIRGEKAIIAAPEVVARYGPPPSSGKISLRQGGSTMHRDYLVAAEQPVTAAEARTAFRTCAGETETALASLKGYISATDPGWGSLAGAGGGYGVFLAAPLWLYAVVSEARAEQVVVRTFPLCMAKRGLAVRPFTSQKRAR